MPSELEIKLQLVNEYQRLMRIRKVAEKEGSTETVAMIDKEVEYIRLILQPMELPKD